MQFPEEFIQGIFCAWKSTQVLLVEKPVPRTIFQSNLSIDYCKIHAAETVTSQILLSQTRE